MYSLVSAPVLGFDLVRRSDGPAVAELLLRALTLRPYDVPALAAVHRPGPARQAAWVDVVAAEAGAARMASIADQLHVDLAAAVTLLERVSIGTLPGLLRLVSHEVLDWTWTSGPDGLAVRTPAAARAAEVVEDAIAALYVGALVEPVSHRVLLAPWQEFDSAARSQPGRATTSEPVLVDLPGSADLPGPLAAALGRLARLDPADVGALRAAVDRDPAHRTGWAMAAHRASWAVHLAGRTRAAAGAQLRAVTLVRAAGVSVADAAAGVWNLVGGALHALAVTDLLDADSHRRLVHPLREALGDLG
ncbi:MAG TPA: hypothetical protein VLC50_02720 [Actinomycetes bacterium]|nr:hypothetical protein [Actinomycetes bacterium]